LLKGEVHIGITRTIRELDQFIPVPFIKREVLLGKNAAMFSLALYSERSLTTALQPNMLR